MVKVKICGITNLDDALHAVECGADALGFNFYKKSPRFISAADASEITRQLGSVLKVGVFVNEQVDAIAQTVRIAGLDAVQLHGDESPAIVRELGERVSCEVIKAFRVSPEFIAESVFESGANTILLDGFSLDAHGGTGEAFDWNIAKRLSSSVKLYLAGGLSGDNVRKAILDVSPYAVDACSLLESAPGKKDPQKVRRFIMEAKRND
ncbi:MAG TPA: phosphoribosylanthranilate isomerase [Pyrinomonadaceae bacterium]